jgi:hypothetical protein
VKFCIEIGHKQTNKFFIKLFFYTLTITNMATVQNFDVISAEFGIVRICTSGNYTQKCFTKLYNFFVFLASISN